MFCTKCGNEIKEGEQFCTNCGTKIGEEDAMNQEVTTETKKKKSPILIIGIVAVIAVVAVISVFAVNKHHEKEIISGVYNKAPAALVDAGIDGVTVGKAFDEYFNVPEWSYEKDEKGKDIVIFEGETVLPSGKADIRMEFYVKDGGFELQDIYIDGKTTDLVDSATLVIDAYTQYMDNHNIEYSRAALGLEEEEEY